MIFDTHSHYTSHQFDADRAALLDSLPAQGVCGVVDCGTDYATTLKSLELARQYPWFYTAAGIHPESLIEEDASTNTQFGGDWRAELAQLEMLLSDPRVVAVGECGLDYHWPVPKDAQLEMFEAHLALAKKHDMPVLVHDREAHADTYALLAQYRPKGIVHCFSGSAPDAVRLAQQGMYIGFGGVLTFANARKTVEAAAALPLERIVLETDCPYMAPVPFRGKRCDSGMILYVAQKLSEIHQKSVEEVLSVTEQNAHTLFRV